MNVFSSPKTRWIHVTRSQACSPLFKDLIDKEKEAVDFKVEEVCASEEALKFAKERARKQVKYLISK